MTSSIHLAAYACSGLVVLAGVRDLLLTLMGRERVRVALGFLPSHECQTLAGRGQDVVGTSPDPRAASVYDWDDE